MPNTINGAGLQVKTLTEIIASLTAGLQTIYGSDINVEQNSPDGQLIGIFAQAAEDNLEVLLDGYNGFAVESAYGVVLDQRVALNGLTRRAGTYTTTPVDITVNIAVTLIGLDELETDPEAQVFTVKDEAGNQWLLAATTIFAAPGTDTLTFRAAEVGAVEVTANTITNQATTVLGVTDVNNPDTTGTVVGVNEETDPELKIRHGRSFKLASTGPADAVEAALLQVDEVADALVIENDTNGTVDGTGAHSIWCIVRGAAAPADIAQAIYSKKAPGCGMRGAVEFDVERPNGTVFTAKWDEAVAQDLYIQFGIIPRINGQTFDEDSIKVLLAQALSYRLNQVATIGDIVQAMAIIAPNAIVVSPGVGDDGMAYDDTIGTDTPKNYFVAAATRVDIT
jgi:uncharacterized phage protein gp47/JayE